MIYIYTVHRGVTSKGTVLLLRVVESAVKNIGPMSILISEMAKTRLHAQIVLETTGSITAAVRQKYSGGKTVKTRNDTSKGRKIGKL
jgi:hypothetical protein